MVTKENKVVTLPAHIRVRRDTLANWTSINPVLDDGELAIVRMPDGSITMRVGTGADSFKNLPDISNSSADEIHILDSVTIEQLSGTLSTSDYELCANNHVIGVKAKSEGTIKYFFYKIAEYSGNYFFGAISEDALMTIIVQASKEYTTTQTDIPTFLEVSGNTVKMDGTERGVTFDLAKDASGKVQITLNGAAVGTGITLPEVAIPEYTLEKSGEEVSLKKDGTVVGDSITVASNNGKLRDYYGNEIFNADQSEESRIVFLDCGNSTLPTLQKPFLLDQENTGTISTLTIMNLNSFTVELWDSVRKMGEIPANSRKEFIIGGSVILHFEALECVNSDPLSIDFGPAFSIDSVIAASQADTVVESWIGYEFPIKIDEKDVLFRISDVNTYDLSDGSGKSHYTLEMKEILENRPMHKDPIENWAGVNTEEYLNSDKALNRIEEKVRNAIQQVKVPYGAIYNKDSLQYVDNKIFYPSCEEVDVWNYSATAEGRLWKYYKDHRLDSAKIKHLNSVASKWWLRSWYRQYSPAYCCINTDGSCFDNNADNTSGSSWVFCI